MRLISVLIVSVLFLNLNHLNAQSNPPPITLRISSTYVTSGRFSPSFILIIERHPDNKSVTFQWDCTYEYGSTLKQLNGEKSPRVFQNNGEWARGVYFDAGTCEIVITLERSSGDDKSFRTLIEVRGIE